MMTFCLQKRIIYVCMDFQQKLTYPMRTGYPLLHFSVTRSCLEFPYVLVQASDLSREKGIEANEAKAQASTEIRCNVTDAMDMATTEGSVLQIWSANTVVIMAITAMNAHLRMGFDEVEEPPNFTE
ncbi:hypothetical protein Vadar_001553 [Vaccinium darrowii]|uniref:Uncharacterized protein n=1 Tax=Vaccinium darrowii TaxID=229202 RepID=A0ACB7YSQ2_9ERIC|nr:hypothetical protein Vadar_001553 [Vaccinium darrowii]